MSLLAFIKYSDHQTYILTDTEDSDRIKVTALLFRNSRTLPVPQRHKSILYYHYHQAIKKAARAARYYYNFHAKQEYLRILDSSVAPLVYLDLCKLIVDYLESPIVPPTFEYEPESKAIRRSTYIDNMIAWLKPFI